MPLGLRYLRCEYNADLHCVALCRSVALCRPKSILTWWIIIQTFEYNYVYTVLFGHPVRCCCLLIVADNLTSSLGYGYTLGLTGTERVLVFIV